jgi:hypothetical protein
MVASNRGKIRALGGLVFLMGLISLVGWPFAPMHQREVLAAGGDTFSDTMHLVLGGVNSLLFVLAIAVGILAFTGRFRWYSIATLIVVLVFGSYVGMESADVAANEPTPWLGIAERIVVFGSMLWVGVLGLVIRTEMRERESNARP